MTEFRLGQNSVGTASPVPCVGSSREFIRTTGMVWITARLILVDHLNGTYYLCPVVQQRYPFLINRPSYLEISYRIIYIFASYALLEKKAMEKQ